LGRSLPLEYKEQKWAMKEEIDGAEIWILKPFALNY
jgi:hypothetical protein